MDTGASDSNTHVELSRTQLALEVLRLLVLQQDWGQHCCHTRPNLPFSSSNSRSQYQHHGLSTWGVSAGIMGSILATFKGLSPLLLSHDAGWLLFMTKMELDSMAGLIMSSLLDATDRSRCSHCRISTGHFFIIYPNRRIDTVERLKCRQPTSTTLPLKLACSNQNTPTSQ